MAMPDSSSVPSLWKKRTQNHLEGERRLTFSRGAGPVRKRGGRKKGEVIPCPKGGGGGEKEGSGAQSTKLHVQENAGKEKRAKGEGVNNAVPTLIELSEKKEPA